MASAHTSEPAIGELVDNLGRTRARICELEKVEKMLKESITARGVTEAEGAIYRLQVISAVRWVADLKRIRQDMGEAWVDARSKQMATVSLRTSIRSEAVAQLAEAA